MKSLFNFLKRNSKFFLILFLLVVFQAFCDFTIPKYTYELIDVGIINDGVTEEVPTVIRRSSMKELTNFMTKEEKNKVLNSYSFINKKYEMYIKKYPVLKEEAIYLLNGERHAELDSILGNAILLSISDDYDDVSKIVPKVVMAEGETLEDVFKRLTEDEKNSFIEQFNENKKDIFDLTVSDYINSYIKKEYKEVGFNISSIKNKYLVEVSLKLGVLFIFKIVSLVYLIKKVFDISLNTTKMLSKDILNKASKLTYQEITECDVKSLIMKNPNDIRNLPMLVFTCFQMLFYVIVFGLLFIFTLRNSVPSTIILKFVAVELLIMLVLIVVGYIILKIFKKEKSNKNILVSSCYFLSFSMSLFLLLTIIVGIVLTCFKVEYISLLSLNLGEVLLLVGYTIEMVIVILFFIISIVDIFKIVKSSKKIKKLMMSQEYIKDPEKPKKFRKNSKHFVEFKNVYVKANNEECTNINFKINANSIFGILCSTKEEGNLIAKLLLKLVDLENGNIVIDGIDINDVELKDLRTKIYCFYPKNVWYYEEDLESTKFLKSPDIYILNDFNGDLSLDDDEALNYFLTKKAKNKIIIILSTNIDNLMNADKLAVVSDGKIVGLGKHKELIKTCKEYQSIIESKK